MSRDAMDWTVLGCIVVAGLVAAVVIGPYLLILGALVLAVLS